MGLDSIFAAAVEAARAGTESLGVHADVVHEAWLSQGGLGEPSYADPVTRPGIVVEGQQPHQTRDGQTVTVRACVLFFPSAEGEAPPDIGKNDILTLPSGLTGPIKDIVDEMHDPVTGAVLMRTVWLG